MSQGQRLHSLDNLRAIMMWLGIVLHVSVNYTAGPRILPWHDNQSTLLADLLVVVIHVFRMPVFFILAGFFVTLQIHQRGVEGMLHNRMRRLALPFMLFWPVLFLASGLLVSLYAHLNLYGTVGLDASIVPKIPDKPLVNTAHLWFIYYLILFCLTTAVTHHLSKYLTEAHKTRIASIWKTLSEKWWGFTVLALPLALTGFLYRGGVVMPGGSFIPNPAEFIHNGMFFLFGCYLYRHQSDLLALYVRYRWRYMLAGFLVLFVYLALFKRLESLQDTLLPLKAGMALLYNCVSWLWCFGLIGLFLHYLPKQNRGLAYIADSSYWVYLVHLLATIGFGALLYDSPLNAIGRMGCNIVLTTATCLLSYQLLVRHTWLGRFLNGQIGLKKLNPVTNPS
ncbi:acyltransferase family protein [Undibacterium sp. Jales W-56]|uniref:acyltransferase family protein n=1 Tax=Undibacterium sp. Jales W-56 TaxID=2897325 RepID=UPI0021CDF208|nr:acyltransferase family protein [Undibacterium sp. Jales W-56]MCU6434069.1 acyltransferase family protein [Undibacterium sp. Jales W-56]